MSPQKSNKSSLYIGGILIAIGLLFLLNNTRLIEFDFIFKNFWPLLLIALGIFIVYQSYRKKESYSYRTTFGDRSEHLKEDYVSASHTFGDFQTSIESSSFKGGRLQTTFGELHLDLTRSHVAEGENLLNVNVTFGEIMVKLPGDIPVRVSASNVAGDIKIFDQKWEGLNRRAVWQSDAYESADAKLDIVCNIVFGDIHIW
ncbi:hypothetical protein JXA70_01385 [candidate division KSB1 bacterium]|nr:hypothetical protein [candidate division KSB1 bacterium]